MPGGDDASVQSIAGLLSRPPNIEILLVLSVRDSYPRELSLITGRDETDISRRLRRLERAGLVEGYWRRLAGRNVRVYRLAARSIVFRFEQGRVVVEIAGRGHIEASPLPPPPPAPSPGMLVGRDELLELLSGLDTPWTHLYGLPGVGKTAVAASLASSSGRPVVWITGSPMDTARSIAWRLALPLLGRGLEGLIREALGGEASIGADLIASAIEEAGALVVVDDAHSLGGGARALIRETGRRVERGRLLTVSRRPPRSNIVAAGVEVPPLDRESYAELARLLLGPDKSIGVEAWELGRGIPQILVQARALMGSGRGPLEALKLAARSYYEGVLPLLDPDASSLALVLAAAGGPVRAGLACRAAGLRGASCHRALILLVSEGLAETSGEMVRLRLPIRPRGLLAGEALASLVDAALSSGRPEERVWALEVAAERCWAGTALGVVRDRLYRAELWPFCCGERYRSALEMLLSCPRLGPGKIYVEAELFVAGLQTGRIPMARAMEGLVRLAGEAGFDRLLQFRLYSIAASLAYNLGRPREALDLFDRMMAVLEGMGRRERRWAEPVVYSVLTALHYSAGKYDEALRAAEKEADAYARLGDINNYYTAIIHKAELLRLTGRPREALEVIAQVERELAGTASILVLERLILIVKTWSLLALGMARKAARALEEKPEASRFPDLRLAQAVALYLQGDGEAARRLLAGVDREGLDTDEKIILDALEKAVEGGRPRPPRRAAPWVRQLVERIAGA